MVRFLAWLVRPIVEEANRQTAVIRIADATRRFEAAAASGFKAYRPEDINADSGGYVPLPDGRAIPFSRGSL